MNPKSMDNNVGPRLGRGIGGLIAGFLAGVILSLVTDIALHAIGLFHASGEAVAFGDGSLLAGADNPIVSDCV